jgi:hypothetical protein
MGRVERRNVLCDIEIARSKQTEKNVLTTTHLEGLGRVMLMRREPPAEELEAYLGLKPEEIAQIALLLLMQDSVGERLHALLSQSGQSPLKPAA